MPNVCDGSKRWALTAQLGLYSTILQRLHPVVWPSAGVKASGASSVSGHPVMGGNGPRGPGGKLGVCRSLGVWGLGV